MDRPILAYWHTRKTMLVIALATVLLALVAVPALAALKNGTPGNDNILGTEGPDTIYGRAGNDTLRGLGAGDRLHGNTGNDTAYGGGGNDQLYGQDGKDTLYGDAGDDRLAGHGGDDVLVGGDDGSTDEYYGGPGHDICVIEPNERNPNNNFNCEVLTKKLP